MRHWIPHYIVFNSCLLNYEESLTRYNSVHNLAHETTKKRGMISHCATTASPLKATKISNGLPALHKKWQNWFICLPGLWAPSLCGGVQVRARPKAEGSQATQVFLLPYGFLPGMSDCGNFMRYHRCHSRPCSQLQGLHTLTAHTLRPGR